VAAGSRVLLIVGSPSRMRRAQWGKTKRPSLVARAVVAVSNADQGDDDLHRPSRVAHIAIIAIQRPFIGRTVPEIGRGRKGAVRVPVPQPAPSVSDTRPPRPGKHVFSKDCVRNRSNDNGPTAPV
jgi:hypothetical protein